MSTTAFDVIVIGEGIAGLDRSPRHWPSTV